MNKINQKFCVRRIFKVIAFTIICYPILFSQNVFASQNRNALLLTIEGGVEFRKNGITSWQVAKINQKLEIGDWLKTDQNSRATLRLTDFSILRINELTSLQILTPKQSEQKKNIKLNKGSLYFFSREKPESLNFETSLVRGAVRGTEFNLTITENGETDVSLIDGEVELSNQHGDVILNSGEKSKTRQGSSPNKTPLIDVLSPIQWTLYYPAILDPADLKFSDKEKRLLNESIDNYLSGDLLSAVQKLPKIINSESDSVKTYRAALNLSVGQVNKVNKLIKNIHESPITEAISKMIVTVQYREWDKNESQLATATECLSESYYLQSKGLLSEALFTALKATEISPNFGYAWIRLAELEFSFGQNNKALTNLETGLKLSPNNAQGLALLGFVNSANGNIVQAARYFNDAINIDGSLGNAWLGRGLIKIHNGQSEEGRKDIQVAASLEPQKSIIRSYHGKALYENGDLNLAKKELRRAVELDKEDPTSWLYSGLLKQQQNQINEGISDIETSQALNNNRRIYRSKLLLDKDRAVRGANLSSLYRDAGMENFSIREASRAVHNDYANFSAHRFLASSYELLVDPKRINSRFDASRVSELLVSNLLAPIGSGNLSQNISQQDYVRLFDKDYIGASHVSDYRGNGDYYTNNSIYGKKGSTSYAIEGAYLTDNGQRLNNKQDQFEVSFQLKHQINTSDSLYLQAEYFESDTGDLSQYYNPNRASTTAQIGQTQAPNIFIGFHREWNPGSHTLFLASRLEDNLNINDKNSRPLILSLAGSLSSLPSVDLDFNRDAEAYTSEIQHFWQTHKHTTIVGARLLFGNTDTSVEQLIPLNQMFNQKVESHDQRLSVYGYHQWKISNHIQLTAGLSYDNLIYPNNINIAPVADEETDNEQLSPKIGALIQPWTNGNIRASYTQSLGGLFFDDSVRLEPTQIAGFNQTFKSLIPDSKVGQAPGTEFETFNIGIDHVFESKTYIGIEGEILKSNADRTVGIFTSANALNTPSATASTQQILDFEEKSAIVTINQLVGNHLSLGLKYKISEADLIGNFPVDPAGAINQNEKSTLQEFDFSVHYNHQNGFFGQFDTLWRKQSNRGFSTDQPGDDFWQYNLFVGYRLEKRHAEFKAGILNINDTDYQLDPLNFSLELPRERMFTLSFKINL